MVTYDGLMRIFWPSDAPTGHSPGVLVGFRNSQRDVFVVAILPEVGLANVETGLLVGTLLRHKLHDTRELLKLCQHSSLRALGQINPPDASKEFDPLRLIVYTEPGRRVPRLHCPGDAPIMFQIIVYDRPHPKYMQYLSLTPISLALGDKAEADKWDPAFKGIEEEEEDRERCRKAKLVEKLKLHSVIAHSPTQKELLLPTIIDQINCSHELNSVLQKNIGAIGRRAKRAMSVSERVAASANTLWDCIYDSLARLWWSWLYPAMSHVFILTLMAQRVTSELVLRLLNWPLGSSKNALKDISATAQQLDIRLQQLCYWPIQYMTLRGRKANWGSITTNHPEYIRFYNSLWLVANDVIIGAALGSFILQNSYYVAGQFDMVFHQWSIEGLRRMIMWLSQWPGGLKLNTELTAFLGDLFLWVIDAWAGMSR